MVKTSVAVFVSLFAVAVCSAQTHSADSIHFQKQLFSNQSFLSAITLTPVVPQGFCTKNLPFFCDKEYKLEKLTKIPFRFRLGSVEYCDKMEGKNK